MDSGNGRNISERLEDDEGILQAMNGAVARAIWEHGRVGNPIATWENGKVVVRHGRSRSYITHYAEERTMAIKHAALGERIDLSTYGPQGTDTHTVALVKTEQFETIRMFARAGSTVPPHKVDGPITVQCLRGEAKFFVGSEPRDMSPGSWLHIEGGKMHAIEAISDCVLLVTIVFAEHNESPAESNHAPDEKMMRH